jgi:hypothetical protein
MSCYTNRLNCKPFSWYLSNVYPELRVPDASPVAQGSVSNGNKCLDSLAHTAGQGIGLYGCHGQGGNQAWQLTSDGMLQHMVRPLQHSMAELLTALVVRTFAFHSGQAARKGKLYSANVLMKEARPAASNGH